MLFVHNLFIDSRHWAPDSTLCIDFSFPLLVGIALPLDTAFNIIDTTSPVNLYITEQDKAC